MLVATDDKRIFDAVKAFGGEARMTRADHPSGTDRVAEVAAAEEGAEVIVRAWGGEGARRGGGGEGGGASG